MQRPARYDRWIHRLIWEGECGEYPKAPPRPKNLFSLTNNTEPNSLHVLCHHNETPNNLGTHGRRTLAEFQEPYITGAASTHNDELSSDKRGVSRKGRNEYPRFMPPLALALSRNIC